MTYEITSGQLAFEDAFSGTLEREIGEDVGNYTIQQGSLSLSDNYALSFESSNLIVTKAAQAIELLAIEDKVVSAPPFEVSVSSSSGLSVSIEVTGPARVENGSIILDGTIGTVTVTASQPGDNNHLAAQPVSTSFEVISAGVIQQTITFAPLENRVFGDPSIALVATATSGLPVYFEVAGPAILSGNILSITGAGEVTVTALQAGDITYASAETTQSFAVARLEQVITLPGIGDRLITDAPFSIGAIINSSLDLIYEVSGPATISADGLVTVSGTTGLVTVTVSQSGDDNHTAAMTVSESFLVTDPGKSNQVITFPTITTKTFGQAAFTLAATSDSDLPVTYEVVGGPISIDGSAVTITGAGTATVRALQDGDGSFNPATPVERSFAISRANQTISFTTISDKVYGDNDFTLSASSSAGLAVDFRVSDGAARVAGSRVEITGAGEVTIEATQAGNANYNPVSTSRTFAVAKAPLTVKADDLVKVYGADNPTLTLTYEGFVNGDDASDITPPVASTSADATSPVTEDGYAIVISGGEADNYVLTLVDGVLSVAKAELIATADDVQRTFGVDNPAFTISYEGFVNDDTEADITAPVGSTTATSTSQNGTYEIVLTGGSAQNYTLVLQPGTLTVGRAQLIVRANNQTKTYGAPNPELTLTYEGFVEGDSEVDIVPPLATTEVVESTVPGVYAIVLTGGSAGNYDLMLEDAELTVIKAPLTVTANDKAIDYNESLPSLDYAYSGFVNGEDASALELEPTITTEAVESANAGTYSIAVVGGQSALYEFSYVEGTLTINKLQATITVTELEQVLSDDGNQPVVTTDPVGLAYIITYDGLEEVPSAAGEYEVTITIDDANYEGFVTGTLTIEEAVTAIEDLPVSVSLYPNPVQRILSVEVTNSSLDEVEVYNLSGVRMMGSPLIGHKAEIDVQAWPVGIYLIRLTASSGETLMQRKFIKE
ncbi:MAG: MBG domain-containing protein [Cyclobacteriaceae bacterium]